MIYYSANELLTRLDDAGLLTEKVEACIKECEPYDAVTHGHWIVGDWQERDGNISRFRGRKCSECFRTIQQSDIPYDSLYCPFCGTKMDKDE